MFSEGNLAQRTLLLWIGVICLSCLGFAQKPGDGPAKRASARYAGSEVCQSCHEDANSSFAESAHEQTLKNAKAADQGCEACHGPGAEHAEMGGDPGKVRSFASATPREILERCQRCHEAASEKEHLRGRDHCLACHSAHHYQHKKFLLRAGK